MHVLLVITDYGSFNNFLSELGLSLIDRRHQVSVICSSSKTIAIQDKADYESLGIKFHFVSFPRSYNVIDQFKASCQIHSLAKSINPDFVHIHFTTAMATTLFLGRLPFYTLGTVHGLGYPVITHPLKKRVFKWVEKTIVQRVDEFWVMNREDELLFAKRYKHKIHRYRTAGVGCDTNKFDPNKITATEREKWRQEMKIDKAAIVFLYIGRFVHFKGFHLVVRAFLEFAKTKGTEIGLLLVGGKDSLHSSGLTDVEEMEIGSHPLIRLVPYTLDVDKYLSISDAMVFPSVKEGMPVCIMEALAMHVPVITSDSRGCNELVKDRVNGYLLSSPPDVEEVKTAMETFCRDAKEKKTDFIFNPGELSLSRQDYVNEQIRIYQNITSRL